MNKEILKIEGRVDFSLDNINGFTNLKEGGRALPDKWTYYMEFKGLLKDGKRYEITVTEI